MRRGQLMKQDLTPIDRVIRLLLAVAIVASYYMGLLSGLAVVILGIVAVAFLITSVFA
jgi:uncharacterized membrane protein